MWAQVSFISSQSTRLTDEQTDDRPHSHGYTVHCITFAQQK